MLIPEHPIQKSLADFKGLFMRQALAVQAGRQPIHTRLNELFDGTRILEPLNPEVHETQSGVARTELLNSLHHLALQRFNVAAKQATAACMLATNSVASNLLRMGKDGQISITKLDKDPDTRIELADMVLTRAGKGAHTGTYLLSIIAWHTDYWSEHLQGSRKLEMIAARLHGDNLLKFIIALPSLSMPAGPAKNEALREELRLHNGKVADASPETIETIFWEANTAEADSAESHTAMAGKLCDYLALQPAPLEAFVRQDRHIKKILGYAV